jgi:hypothetical protein
MTYLLKYEVYLCFVGSFKNHWQNVIVLGIFMGENVDFSCVVYDTVFIDILLPTF